MPVVIALQLVHHVCTMEFIMVDPIIVLMETRLITYGHVGLTMFVMSLVMLTSTQEIPWDVKRFVLMSGMVRRREVFAAQLA